MKRQEMFKKRKLGSNCNLWTKIYCCDIYYPTAELEGIDEFWTDEEECFILSHLLKIKVQEEIEKREIDKKEGTRSRLQEKYKKKWWKQKKQKDGGRKKESRATQGSNLQSLEPKSSALPLGQPPCDVVIDQF